MTQHEVKAKLENIENVGYKITNRQIVIGLFTVITVIGSSVGSAVWWYAERVQSSRDFKIYVKDEFKQIKKDDSVHWLEVRRNLNMDHFKDSVYLDIRFQRIEEKIKLKRLMHINTDYVTAKRDPTTGILTFLPVK